jgi:hypothetical protein
VKKVVLVNRQLTIEFLRPTHQGLVHDKRIIDTTPYPLPHGSLLLQDLGFLAFTLEGVSIEMPTKKRERQPVNSRAKGGQSSSGAPSGGHRTRQ